MTISESECKKYIEAMTRALEAEHQANEELRERLRKRGKDNGY